MMVAHLHREREDTNGPKEPLAVDFAALLRGQSHPDQVLAAKCEAAHCWREVAATLEVGEWVSFHKVKAHRAEDSAISENDKAYILGNNYADWLAKQGSRSHDFDPSLSDTVDSTFKQFKELFVGMGKVLALWPPPVICSECWIRNL
eukprot:1759083-Pyramimonas_sp.AAC.1